jgi:hypothetical protein
VASTPQSLRSGYSRRGPPQCTLSLFTSHFSVHFHWKLRSTDPSNSRPRHPVRRLPPPPGRSILRRQARICQFCGAKELAKGHELSLLRRGNLCAARASSQRAARAAAPRFRAPPFSSPSFASARRSFCYANLSVNLAISPLISKKLVSQLSGRSSSSSLPSFSVTDSAACMCRSNNFSNISVSDRVACICNSSLSVICAAHWQHLLRLYGELLAPARQHPSSAFAQLCSSVYIIISGCFSFDICSGNIFSVILHA